MIREQATMSKEVNDVLLARWEGFRQLARRLPNHHILAVELVRTPNDETIAVFTVVVKGAPVKYAVTGDAKGRIIPNGRQPQLPQDTDDCHPRQPDLARGAAHALEVMVGPEGSVDPSFVAIGHPPPSEPIPPGVAAVGEALLSVAFNTGENVDV